MSEYIRILIAGPGLVIALATPVLFASGPDTGQEKETTLAIADDPGKKLIPGNKKPYEIIDGNISANAIEGWKTYNGGGCGACHGKGGIGAVGPNLAESISTKLSEEQFRDLVINGVPGTMMRPNKTNRRVVDNIDKLYAYLLARSDSVLGPENLIKYPMGKKD